MSPVLLQLFSFGPFTVSVAHTSPYFPSVTSLLRDSSAPGASSQILGIATSIVNSVACIRTPVSACAALNRNPCTKISNTCGSCLQGYLGDANANTVCVSAPSSSKGLIRKLSGVQCGFVMCSGIFDKCLNSVCVQTQKSCSNACNGNGQCNLISTNTGTSVSTCKLSDTTCQAMCTCLPAFGGLLCDLTIAEHNSNQVLRSALMEGLLNQTVSQDASLSVVAGWTSSVSSISQNYAELTPASVTNALAVVSTIVAHSATLALPYSQVSHQM